MLTYFMLPNRMIFGPDASKKTGREAAKLGMRTPLLVTDPGLVSTGLAGALERNLADAGLAPAVFSGVRPNPDESVVEAGIAAWDRAGADGLVALGGGSAMDTAKAIGLMKTHPAPLAQYDGAAGGMGKIGDRIPPLIAVPTTAGTGSEVSSFAVITDRKRGMKLALGSPYLIPGLALIDPVLTLALPREVTVNTGVDALTHLVEGYVSRMDNPLADRIALYGLELLGSSLRVAAETPGNLEARSAVMMAATAGALVYNQKFLGMNHSMAHALSAVYDTPHGLANGIFLPSTMRFNRDAAVEKYRDVGRALGGEDGIAEVERMLDGLGIVCRLNAHGARADDVERLAAKAWDDPSHGTNPRQPVRREDFERLFREAL